MPACTAVLTTVLSTPELSVRAVLRNVLTYPRDLNG
jgi:hypothetical protein